MRNEIPFNDDQIEDHFNEQIHAFLGFDDIEYTRETLDAWMSGRRQWKKQGTVEQTTLGGFPALIFLDAQARAGERTQSVIIVDYGAVRAIATF